jgi:Rtf2 RING-finger
MGGDGGVVAVKREYMRGAGTADNTGDYSRSNRGEKVVSDRDDALQRMTTCALTKLPLEGATIVACPWGRLYQKEAAVEALIRRKQSSQEHDELGSHIRGLKDLFPVRFHVPKGAAMPTCPVTGQELNGQLPVILLVPGNPELPNVVSQRAFKEIGKEALQTEYGPFQEEIRLAPPVADLEEIKQALEAKRDKKKEKSSKKKDKKRKETGVVAVVVANNNDKNPKKQRRGDSTGGTSSAAQVARGRVHDAIKANDNLSSLFVKDKKTSHKEQAADLFART